MFEQETLEPDQPATILVVDDFAMARRALAAMLKGESNEVLEASSGAEGLAVLSKKDVDLVVLDKNMPVMDGIECCRRIKALKKTRFVPVLMLTGNTSVEDELAGIRSGADQFLGKPIHPELLRARARALILQGNAIGRLEETETTLFALAQAVEKRDPAMAGHCERLAGLGVAFGEALGLSSQNLQALHRGGYLHDIGKISLSDAILFKTGILDPEERVEMQTHTTRGEEICRPLRSLAGVLPIIRSHHERWNGSGYPDGLAGDAIPLLARVMQLGDVYDALTTERPYKAALGADDAVAVMREEAQRGWSDPDLTRLFIKFVMDEWPPIELSMTKPRMATA